MSGQEITLATGSFVPTLDDMSTVIPRVFNRLFKAKEHRVVFTGLDYSGMLHLYLTPCLIDGVIGKTTLLYRLTLNEIVQTIPTLGFNIENLKVPTRRGVLGMEIWDVGGHECGSKMLCGCCDSISPVRTHYSFGSE